MLLSSSSFSTFLDDLSTNPAALPQPQQIKVEESQQPQQPRQLPKDVNSFGTQPSQQQIGMAMIPEQTMDFSMLSLDSNFNFQPQVFVVDTPEIPAPIDTAALSGKASNFVEETFETDEKLEVPVIDHPIEATEAAVAAPADPDFESDPEFALFHTEPVVNTPKPSDTAKLADEDFFGGLDTDKALSCYEFVDATEEEATAISAIARAQRISNNLEGVTRRLELLTMDL